MLSVIEGAVFSPVCLVCPWLHNQLKGPVRNAMYFTIISNTEYLLKGKKTQYDEPPYLNQFGQSAFHCVKLLFILFRQQEINSTAPFPSLSIPWPE